MSEHGNPGHRQRLKARFLAGEEAARTEEAGLELLLSYAIPQKDVQPLAKKLLAELGNLDGVLTASTTQLYEVEGVKEHSATLLKLVNWIRTRYTDGHVQEPLVSLREHAQPALFDLPSPEKTVSVDESKPKSPRPPRPPRGAVIFGKSVLKEAVEILPKLPDTQSVNDARRFLRDSLHFSAEETRRRYSNYIVRRMFSLGFPDQAMRVFAVEYAGRQELRDACYYRFCKAEPLMPDVVLELLLPAIGNGQMLRPRLRHYLAQRFPSSKSINDCAKAIVDTLVAGGVAKADRSRLAFAFREILLSSFAFVVHSEFPEPGMFDVSALEDDPAVRAMLWRPDSVVPALYELRNRGIISKISEIDNIRQFTTRYTLSQVVELLINGKR